MVEERRGMWLALVVFVMVAGACVWGIVNWFRDGEVEQETIDQPVIGQAGTRTPTWTPVPIPTSTPTATPTSTSTPTAVPTPVIQATATATEVVVQEQPTQVEEDQPVVQDGATATLTIEPSPTLSPQAENDQPEGVPISSLVGTIAYPVFNGQSYDLYFGRADGSGTRLFQTNASQPAFSADGSKIAFHSWDDQNRGLMTMDVNRTNPIVITSFVEDHLPTWSVDGKEIIYLSRREGDRKSRLMKVGSTQTSDLGFVLGEGEYPTIGLNNQLVFKGWGRTGVGLRLATISFKNIQVVTEVDLDMAPALSPDGQQIVFTSRREGNWEVYILNVEAGGLLRLTVDPDIDGLPTWSPDGQAIAFVSNRGGAWGVWVMTPDGQGQRQLFEMEGPPDGFVGTEIATDASRGWIEERISWTGQSID